MKNVKFKFSKDEFSFTLKDGNFYLEVPRNDNCVVRFERFERSNELSLDCSTVKKAWGAFKYAISLYNIRLSEKAFKRVADGVPYAVVCGGVVRRFVNVLYAVLIAGIVEEYGEVCARLWRFNCGSLDNIRHIVTSSPFLSRDLDQGPPIYRAIARLGLATDGQRNWFDVLESAKGVTLTRCERRWLLGLKTNYLSARDLDALLDANLGLIRGMMKLNLPRLKSFLTAPIDNRKAMLHISLTASKVQLRTRMREIIDGLNFLEEEYRLRNEEFVPENHTIQDFLDKHHQVMVLRQYESEKDLDVEFAASGSVVQFEGLKFLNTKRAIREEGAAMGHCVGGYANLASTGKAQIYHYHSPNIKEHPSCTIMVQDGQIVQCFGKYNTVTDASKECVKLMSQALMLI